MTWMYTPNYKWIGTLYFIMGLWAGTLGTFLSVLIRLELMQLGGPFFKDPQFYNSIVTAHAFTMVFFLVVPALIGGFGNWLIPLVLATPDTAFSRVIALSLLTLPPALVMLLTSMLEEGEAGTGWTTYPLLSNNAAHTGSVVWLIIFFLHLAGVSSLMSAINFTTTTVNVRPGGTPTKNMLLFIWPAPVTTILLTLVFPALAGALIMVNMDRNCDSPFFEPTEGGGHILLQYLFWFFSHPELYTLIMPGFGIIFHIMVHHSKKKKAYGALGVQYVMCAIGLLGLIVWGHQTYTAGLYVDSRAFFAWAIMKIAVPMGIKVFSWMATVSDTGLSMTVPMMRALGFVLLFTMGGLTGVVLANAVLDIALHGHGP